MWAQLIDIAQSPYTQESEVESLVEIQRQRYLAEAYFRLPDVAAGQAVLENLQRELERIKSERETALAVHHESAGGVSEQQSEILKGLPARRQKADARGDPTG